MVELAVKIDYVAFLREERNSNTPDPVAAALLAELAGAEGIVVQVRHDKRTIQDRDIRILRKVVQTQLILEMAPNPEMIGVALDIKPDRVILVPEKREEKTDEGGMDLIVHKSMIAETVATLHNSAIPVSVFIDPVPEQLKIAHQCNARMITLNTGPFCETAATTRARMSFSKIADCIKLAPRLKLGVSVSNGLDYKTVKVFRELKEIDEFIMGHSVIARSVLVGVEKAVKELIQLINRR